MQSVGSTGLQVIRNALDSVTDIISVTLVRTARSPIVRIGWDFSSAILSPEGELVGQGLSQPLHLAGMMPALRGCLDRYEGRIYPGDVLANNDPYEGGSHLPDIYLFKPVFVGDVLVAYVSTMATMWPLWRRRPRQYGDLSGGAPHPSPEVVWQG